ncbi:MAG: undecaprenyl-diphosphate phosphatase [Desulfobacteraceae bacterium]|nr:undecaprenyl-diphosphate phosphatase [Desulfobacteraceae bacterium]
MNWIESILLGIIQGLTEFLPVSSSGHLVLLQHLFGMKEPQLFFNICLHAGTLIAVLMVFKQDTRALLDALAHLPAHIKSYGGLRACIKNHPQIRLIAMIVVGSIPTAAMGILFAQIAEQLFGSLRLVSVMLGITGLFLWFSKGHGKQGLSIDCMSWKDAFIIGVAQGLAIIPGISRSGATITTALFLGIDRELAGRFSFLLSIPAILGALVFGLDAETFQPAMPAGMVIMGSLSAVIVGYFALRILMRLVNKGRLHGFAFYCGTVCAAALFASFII